jgi:hypothetical protein
VVGVLVVVVVLLSTMVHTVRMVTDYSSLLVIVSCQTTWAAHRGMWASD